MQKIYLSLLSLCLSVGALFSQTLFAPLGTHWNYTFHAHDGGLLSDYEIRVTHDTLIGNAQVKTLSALEVVTYALQPHQFYSDSSYFGTLTYRNDSVFMSNCTHGTNGYLFDFDMSVGDSIPMWAPGGVMYGRVTGVDSVLVGTVNRQRWHLDKFCDAAQLGTIEIIEGIGPVDDFLAYNHEGCQFGTGWWTFECFASSLIGYNEPCAQLVLTAVAEPRSAASWSIFPNPADAQLQIAGIDGLVGGSVQVTDLQGRIIWQSGGNWRASKAIPTSDWPQGMYWVRVAGGGQASVKPLVIAR
jgi:hypothetical protein